MNARLLAAAESLLPEWLPGGHWEGHNWRCSGLNGGSGDSLSINIQNGAWFDFARIEDKGGDLTSLYARIHHIDNGEAFRQLSGTADELPRINGHRAAPALEQLDEEPVAALPPPDVSFEPSQFRHSKCGKPSKVWVYRDAEGQALRVVARYDFADHKVILPWIWNGKKWINRAGASPRPLYGLDRLAKLAGRVLIVEGEKCADSAQDYFPTRPCMTWAGGVSGMRHADWQPIAGRPVTVWPDNDPPGIDCGLRLAARLHALGCDVKLIDPKGRTEGWDVADALQSGMPRKDLIAWLAERSKDVTDAPVEPEAKPKPKPVARVQTAPAAEVIEADPVAGSLVQQWQEHGFTLKGNGRPMSIASNVMRCIPIQGADCWFDDFTQTIMMNGRPYDDHVNMEFTVWIQERRIMADVSPGIVMDGVLAYALRHRRNPVKDWMLGLNWDGTPRLRQWLHTGMGAKNNRYHAEVGRCFLTAIVARVFQPGCQHRCMPVFEGEQNQGKTKALKILGGQYHAEVHERIDSKDFYLAITGVLIAEISEMHAFKGAEIDKIKGIISTPVDRYRAPYGRISSDHPRSCVFAGTTNRDDWITDETGATRFWPVRTGKIDLDWITANRDQLFAEAVHAYQAGSDWWQVPDDDSRRQTEARADLDVWHDHVMTYCEGRESVTIPLIIANSLEIKKQDADLKTQHRVGRILRQAGWKNICSWVDGKTVRRWVPKKV